MKQRDIEAVMAAAWNVADAVPLINRVSAGEELRTVLREVDPNGLYRPRPAPVAIPADKAGVHT